MVFFTKDMTIHLRTEDAPSKWIKAGVCLLTSTEV